jgi:NitT/TauT family transport system substrate-binding protein
MDVRRAAIAVIAGTAMVVFSAGHVAALEKVRVTVAAVSSNYGPYFNAIEQGYFRDEGLDVEIVNAGGGIATPALISGEMAFSTSPASAFSAILKGARLKVIVAEADRPTYQLWTTSDDLDTIQKLKGKTVGIQTRGDTFEIWMRLVLKSHGMSGDDVGYTPLGFGNATRLAAIKTGSIPAVVLSSLDVAALRQDNGLGKGHMLEDAMKDAIRMPYNGVATSDALIKESPHVVLSFVRAVVKGTRFMTAFKDETIANVMKYNNADRQSTEVDYDDVVRTLTKDGSVPAAVQRAEAEVRAELLQLPKDKIPPLAQMFDFSFVRKASASLDAEGWKPAR